MVLNRKLPSKSNPDQPRPFIDLDALTTTTPEPWQALFDDKTAETVRQAAKAAGLSPRVFVFAAVMRRVSEVLEK